jgi:enoyl-CoA hydratase/carnithine racemase
MFETIITNVADGIFTLTLNRPDRMNAFTPQMMAEMCAAFDMADADDAVRAVIVTGAGKAFCAGADLAGGGATFDYAQRPDKLEQGSPVRDDGSVDYDHPGVRDNGGKLTLRIATMQLPMDFRLASENARFGFVFARRGIVPEAASSWFLPRLVGIGQALDWCYSGRVFGADEALTGGLVRSIHASDDLLPAARAFAEELTAESAPVSVALTRNMMWRMMGAAHPMDAHRLDSRLIWSRGSSSDAGEGVASFLEKRPATYPDRVSANLPHFSPWMDDVDW